MVTLAPCCSEIARLHGRCAAPRWIPAPSQQQTHRSSSQPAWAIALRRREENSWQCSAGTPDSSLQCTIRNLFAMHAVRPLGLCRRGASRPITLKAYSALGNAAGSLVPLTLQEMDQDKELQAHLQNVATQGQAALTRHERLQRQRSLQALNVPGFQETCKAAGVSPLVRSQARILQLNIGLYCNQACSHCHVESSPMRKEMMDRATADRCLELIKAAGPQGIQTLDITGGAPELNQEFRHLVTSARALGVPEIIDRCNLTVLLEPGQEDLAVFLAQHHVRVVASLPCYGEKNVDAQRGRGVFERSIQALQMLNAVGYGRPGSGLVLDLVYNPGGAFLSPSQATLQDAYKIELREAFNVEFTTLLALNNMPIKRFADWLVRQGKLDEYMHLLVNSFNPAAAEGGLMCRDTVSVGWDGRVYDCDFNQQLELSVAKKGTGSRNGLTVFDVSTLDELTGLNILTDNHCFGCTAGSGSGCGGQT